MDKERYQKIIDPIVTFGNMLNDNNREKIRQLMDSYLVHVSRNKYKGPVDDDVFYAVCDKVLEFFPEHEEAKDFVEACQKEQGLKKKKLLVDIVQGVADNQNNL